MLGWILNLGMAGGTGAATEVATLKKYGGVVSQTHFGSTAKKTEQFAAVFAIGHFGGTIRPTEQYGAAVSIPAYGSKEKAVD